MTRVALEAEKRSVFPKWENCEGRVTVTLPAEGGDATPADIALAEFMEDVAK